MQTLRALQDDDLRARGFSISTAEALRVFLRNCQEVVNLRKAITAGEVSPIDIQSFVTESLRSFRPGTKFPDEMCLSAIAVALETLPGQFADQYLADLAGLRIQEIPLASRVARLCLDRRRKVLPGLTERGKVFTVPSATAGIYFRVVEPIRIEAQHQDERHTLRAAS